METSIEVADVAQLAPQPDLTDRHNIVAKRLAGKR
jgi:hypothetical protein